MKTIIQFLNARRTSLLWRCVAATVSAFSISPSSAGEPNMAWQVLASPENSFKFLFFRGNDLVFSTLCGGTGPHWIEVPLQSSEKATGDELTVSAPFTVNNAQGQVLTVKQRVCKSGCSDISFTFDLSADKDVPLSLFMPAAITMRPQFWDGEILLQHTDGAQQIIPLDLKGDNALSETATLEFRSKTAGDFTATLRPPLPVAYHGFLKIHLPAQVPFKAGKQSFSITYHLPGAVCLLVRQSDIDRFMRPKEQEHPEPPFDTSNTSLTRPLKLK